MAAILTYFRATWSGRADPFLPHLALLSLSVLAGIAVGAGILLERPKYSEATHRIATWLVIVGVAIESLCTVSLFVVDERVSNAQQSKIIALEQDAAPRTLDKDQYNSLMSLRRKVGAINVMASPGSEPFMFTVLIERVFATGGIKWNEYVPPLWYKWWSGIFVCLPKTEGGARNFEHPVFKAFLNAKLDPVPCETDVLPFKNLATDVPLVMIGERSRVQYVTVPYLPEADAPQQVTTGKVIQLQ
jgi:hypothetical protein